MNLLLDGPRPLPWIYGAAEALLRARTFCTIQNMFFSVFPGRKAVKTLCVSGLPDQDTAKFREQLLTLITVAYVYHLTEMSLPQPLTAPNYV